MRKLLFSILLANFLGAVSIASAADKLVTVTHPGGKLLIPAQMFRDETDPSVAIDIGQVALRLGYPELQTSRRPSLKYKGYDELIPLKDAIGVIIFKKGEPLTIANLHLLLLKPARNDLDPEVEFTSYSEAVKGMPERLTHYIYFLGGENRMLINCTGIDPQIASCYMSFDEQGLRWGLYVQKRFILNNVRQFHARLVELIRSFQPR